MTLPDQRVNLAASIGGVQIPTMEGKTAPTPGLPARCAAVPLLDALYWAPDRAISASASPVAVETAVLPNMRLRRFRVQGSILG